MSTGKIKFFKEDKGFGFILDSETNKEVFVHITGCAGPIKKDDEVEFDIEEGKKGLQAVNVKKLVDA